MKRFNFRLQRVIDVRETKEKECQRELADSMTELKKHREILEAREAESRQSTETLRTALKSKTNAAGLTAINNWKQWNEKKAIQQQQNTDKQAEVVDVKRKALLQASKERKILEKLKEKRMFEYQKEMQLKEQNFLDDIGGQRHQMKQVLEAELED